MNTYSGSLDVHVDRLRHKCPVNTRRRISPVIAVILTSDEPVLLRSRVPVGAWHIGRAVQSNLGTPDEHSVLLTSEAALRESPYDQS